MLELAILGALRERDLHGYELKRRLNELVGSLAEVSFGSLYPALARLEAIGAIEPLKPQGSPVIPLTGSLGGEFAAFRAREAANRDARGKKVYRITDRGETVLQDILRTGSPRLLLGDARVSPGAADRLFRVRLAFARYLAPDERIELLEQRRAVVVERIDRLTTRAEAHGAALDGYSRSVHEHDRELLEADLRWLERLAAAERTARNPARGPAAKHDVAQQPAASHGRKESEP